MPKVEQKLGDLRGGKGFGRLTWKQFEALLRHAGHLTDQQRIVKSSIDEDGIQYLTKASGK